MGIINHFSQGNNDQEYEGLHSHWKDEEPVNNTTETATTNDSNWMEDKLNEFYNGAIDHAIEIVLQKQKLFPMSVYAEGVFLELINSLTNLKKK
jgi:hypothetical protein